MPYYLFGGAVQLWSEHIIGQVFGWSYRHRHYVGNRFYPEKNAHDNKNLELNRIFVNAAVLRRLLFSA